MRLKLKIIRMKYSILSLFDICILLIYSFVCFFLKGTNIFFYIEAWGYSCQNEICL